MVAVIFSNYICEVSHNTTVSLLTLSVFFTVCPSSLSRLSLRSVTHGHSNPDSEEQDTHNNLLDST